MKYLSVLFLAFFVSCASDDELFPPVDCTEIGCFILNEFSFEAEGSEKSIVLKYGQNFIIDASQKVCLPDAIDFYISDDNLDFGRVARVDPFQGTLTIDNLQNGKEYFLKMVNLHCELDSIESRVISVTAGEISLPQFLDNPMPSSQNTFEDFRVSPDGDKFIFRNHSNDWFLTSLSNPSSISNIGNNAFYANWNPQSNEEVAFVFQRIIGITWKTESLSTFDINSNTEQVLHSVDNPDDYWIHEFQYSLDGAAMYFMSNKDNGSVTSQEKAVYDNILKFDLQTGEIEALSDFLPEDFDISDFVEDPLQPGNFYVLGGMFNETIDQPGVLGSQRRIDVHYYNSGSRILSPILITDHKEQNISIDPIGANLVFASDKSGSSDLWVYNLETQHQGQISSRKSYSPSYRWHHLNWISDSEFMVYVEHEGTDKFAVFKI